MQGMPAKEVRRALLWERLRRSPRATGGRPGTRAERESCGSPTQGQPYFRYVIVRWKRPWAVTRYA
jgi:hypothetical protein